MKPLRSIVEVAEPKTTAEKAFKAKHKILKHPDRNGNGDDVFNASKVKKVKRAPRHGYDYPDDVKVYESANQSDVVSHNIEKKVYGGMAYQFRYAHTKHKNGLHVSSQVDADTGRHNNFSIHDQQNNDKKIDHEVDPAVRKQMISAHKKHFKNLTEGKVSRFLDRVTKPFRTKARTARLKNKLDNALDDRQRHHGIEPYSVSGKIATDDQRKKLYHDKRYDQLNKRYLDVTYGKKKMPLGMTWGRTSPYMKGKKKAVNENIKVGDYVNYKGQHHVVLHVHGKEGAKDFMTGKYDQSKAGHLNIRPSVQRRISYPLTVAPSEVKPIKEQLNEGVAMDHYVRHHNTAMEHAKNIVYALKQHKSLIDSCPSCHSGHAQDMKYLADNLASAHLQIGQHVENEQRNAKNRATDQKRAKLLSKVKYESAAPYVNYHGDTVASMPMRESQQLDEISKDALQRYLLGAKGKPGAIKDVTNLTLIRNKFDKGVKTFPTADQMLTHEKSVRYFNRKLKSRSAGVDMAVRKLTKEEHLEEGGKSQLMLDLEQLPRHIFKQKYGRSKTIAKKQLQGV